MEVTGIDKNCKWIESSPSDVMADHLMTNEEIMVEELTFSKPEE